MTSREMESGWTETVSRLFVVSLPIAQLVDKLVSEFGGRNPDDS